MRATICLKCLHRTEWTFAILSLGLIGTFVVIKNMKTTTAFNPFILTWPENVLKGSAFQYGFRRCEHERVNYHDSYHDDLLSEVYNYDGNLEPIGEKNIFFLETSISAVENFDLSVRQVCSVESAAKTNPGMQIYLLILSNATFSSTTMSKINILSTYKNIAIRRITIENYLKNTPIEEWWKTGVMNTSKYLTVHTSDVLRLLTLWKFGGIYLDLDMIAMKSLENMTNFAIAEDNDLVANGALGFSATGIGKKTVEACLEDLKENFDGRQWAQQGPLLITRVLQKQCGTSSISEMINSTKTCQGFTVYPMSSFYPIHWRRWESLFDEANCLWTMSQLNESFTVHFWNRMSKERRVKVSSQSPYVTLANKYCPRIYNSLEGFF